MYQLNKHSSPKTPNKKKAEQEFNMVDPHALIITGELWIMPTSETLFIPSPLKKLLSHYKLNIKSPKAKTMSKLVSHTIPSPLPCTDQVTMPIICFQNTPFPYSDTLHSPTDCGTIMPNVQQGSSKQGRMRGRDPSHHVCLERNVHRPTVFTTPWIFMNLFQYVGFEVCPVPSAPSVPSIHNSFPKVTIC